MHLASDACFVRAPSSQDVYVGAAFSRQPVVAYDCGAVAEACPHCGALFFDGESQYLSCCRNGTIVVQQRMVRIYNYDEHNSTMCSTLIHSSP